ncbi:BsuPI-related putative proteinase inhibitor [Bacillus gobiensis]|uniref:BsuPI-related putative proteinase inhibitor n=1 Tax=Bacillus gobiensis TaxID=1441095 RepID=UPI003D1FECD5
MKWFAVLVFSMLLLGACDQKETPQSDKEVSGEVEQNDLALSIEAVPKNGEVEFIMALKNNRNEDVEFTFNTGQRFELVVYDEKGEQKYRYSKGKMFTQAFQSIVLKPSEVYEFTDVWKTENLEPGEYKATVTFLGKSESVNTLKASTSFSS